MDNTHIKQDEKCADKIVKSEGIRECDYSTQHSNSSCFKYSTKKFKAQINDFIIIIPLALKIVFMETIIY